MTTLAECRDQCERYIRSSLSLVSQIVADLPTLPRYRAEDEGRSKQRRFVDETQPNWQLLPKSLVFSLFNSSEGMALAKSLEETPPFSSSVGRWIFLPELSHGSSWPSGVMVAHEIWVSYLFAAGIGEWRPETFDQVWSDCVSYFDPENTTVEYWLYAPIAFNPGVHGSLDLGNGLAIQCLSPDDVARIASLDSNLAGVPVENHRTQWTLHFFVKRFDIEKYTTEDPHSRQMSRVILAKGRNLPQWISMLNEEVAMLRSLLRETLSLPTYALVRNGYLRDAGIKPIIDLPWHATWHSIGADPPNPTEVDNYRQRRASFMALHGDPGWENVAASMRRFAVAWENPFRADILADIVAALEHLMVRGDTEVSYKLKTRTAHYLGKSMPEIGTIAKDLNDAYALRSRVFHGGFVFDNRLDLELATRMKRPKSKLGKGSNPYHDVSEVERLIRQAAGYYRHALEAIIDSGKLDVEWAAYGL